MDPVINSRNSFIHQVTTQALNNLSKIPQLSDEQRNVLLAIINNTDNIVTNYEIGKNTELDKHLNAITIRLGGVEKREEGLGANFMRGLKTTFGSRIGSEELKANLLNPEAAYRRHLLLDPHQILTQEICPSSVPFESLPSDIQEVFNQLLWTHIELKEKKLPPSISPGDPQLRSFMEAFLSLQSSEAKIPRDMRQFLISLSNYIFCLHIPNSQRPFLVFVIKHAQLERLHNTSLDLIEKTRNDPNQALQHQWALDGFITPFTDLNLWEKTTLHSHAPDRYVMNIATRVEGRIPSPEKTVDIPFSLTPFRTNPDSPLTSEQTRKLFEFLKRDSLYENTEESLKQLKRDLDSLDFLTDTQKNLLVETHEKLYHAILSALIDTYTV